jgi:hypothetical protein
MEESQSSARALNFFTVTWSNIAILQCVKQYHSLKGHIFEAPFTLDLFLFYFLLISIVYSTLQPQRSSSLISLCFSHLLSLVHHGSQSNHVIMAIVIASAALLAYSTDRSIWQKRLACTLYFVLVVLYLVSWTHKMNKNWFDREYSCASLFASGFLSMWIPLPRDSSIPISPVADIIIQTAPYQALLIEIALPTTLIMWRTIGKRISARLFPVLMVTAALFHLVICLPLPPMSVYPFSMVMVPMYILLLPEENLEWTTRLSDNFLTVAGTVAVVGVAVQRATVAVLAGEDMPLEYPAYGLWKPSIIWNIAVWTMILYSVFGSKRKAQNKAETKAESKSKADRLPSTVVVMPLPELIPTWRGMFLAAFLFFIGMCPYIGIRNYPALAMFSNLRTEGTVPNHVLLPPIDLMRFQTDTVHIHSTSLKSLQNFQVNLAIYFSEHTKKFNTAYGVTNEFWITPPSWSAPDNRETSFMPFSIPILEFRKHLSKHINEDFYVNFTRNSDTTSSMIQSHDLNSLSLHSNLITPVSWLARTFLRFRSFDPGYSPCRH